MKDKHNFHLKLQEMMDCYATTDPLQEFSGLKNETDDEQSALKWLALAAIHGITDNAEKITITQDEDGSVEVSARYKKTHLLSPGQDVGKKVVEIVRNILHLEEDKGKLPLSLGFRGGSVDVQVKVSRKEGKEKVSIKFP
jgi:hypothetical protein